jgi:hypothetical protein
MLGNVEHKLLCCLVACALMNNSRVIGANVVTALANMYA